MKRLGRAELAELLGPHPPSDAFWSRAIDAKRAVIGVAPEVVGEELDAENPERARRNRRRRGERGPDGPLSTGDIVDVGDHSFVVVAVEETKAGGRRYRLDLVEPRSDE
ncbi:hypothetical protein [Halorubrum sp. CBA1229]|jgi:hypothetical protein|uniref:hypothetical protein n=1 Tax=Halorubrum sp. CBA1229 TaxID=1853699 RepID=UPI000F3C897A|nr:hypothetical protein [Halorubrum sp. CBA1229]QKY16675.1 hypothetical protein Hrr1229_007210 [Halorubrum sp. CBA1229]